MREDLLHFIWKYKKLQLSELETSGKEAVEILDVGTHNNLSGPDFFNSKVKINEQLWAGNVEIHLKSSDWYAHHHERDANYNNVILHVVWEDDCEVFRSDNSKIPTLELKKYISSQLLKTYKELFDQDKKAFINCEKDIVEVDTFTTQNWLERIYFERLERKAVWVSDLLEQSKNDWERVLFVMLLKNFGLNVNGEAFLSLAMAIEFAVIRKLQSNIFQLESVFYGMSHLLDKEQVPDTYYLELQKEFYHQKNKFGLRQDGVQKPEFFKLRPPNFPTIRLSQMANLYVQHQNLFDKIISATNVEELYSIFEVTTSSYWDNHFTFGTVSKKSKKRLTKKFIDLLLINTILPLKFCYAKHLGKDVGNEILHIVSKIKKEDNSIITNFKKLGLPIENAKDSQALLQLYHEYCSKNKCLQCAVGSRLIGS